MKVTKITLEDVGQDFLEMYVSEETGQIIDVKPYGAHIWKGAYVPLGVGEMVAVGEYFPIHNPPHIMYGYLKYKIEKIEQIEYEN